MIDSVFAEWRERELVWIPERGMGYLPVSEQPYDAAYFERYQAMAETDVGRELTRIRVDLVRRHMRGEPPHGTSLLDVGIGCGQFLEAVQHHVAAWGEDVNPAGVQWLEARGFLADRARTFDALTFWDSLEHIAGPAPLLARARRWVFVSLPVVPGDGPPRPEWKHLRRDEHCWYWTRAGLIGWMGEHGFECVEHNTAESLAGRQDIGSFVFRRSG